MPTANYAADKPHDSRTHACMSPSADSMCILVAASTISRRLTHCHSMASRADALQKEKLS